VERARALSFFERFLIYLLFFDDDSFDFFLPKKTKSCFNSLRPFPPLSRKHRLRLFHPAACGGRKRWVAMSWCRRRQVSTAGARERRGGKFNDLVSSPPLARSRNLDPDPRPLLSLPSTSTNTNAAPRTPRTPPPDRSRRTPPGPLWNARPRRRRRRQGREARTPTKKKN